MTADIRNIGIEVAAPMGECDDPNLSLIHI